MHKIINGMVFGILTLSFALGGCKSDSAINEEAPVAEVPSELPLKDFFKNPEKTRFQISPKGDYLSYLAPFEDRMNIFIQKPGSKESKRITSESDRSISSYNWVSDNRVVFTKDIAGDENFYMVSVDVETGEERELTKIEGVKTQFIDELKSSKTDILVGLNKRNPQIFDVYRLNVESAELKMVAENPGNISSWITDNEGEIRLATTTDGVNSTILFRNSEGEDFKEILTIDFKDALEVLHFTPDNENVYAASNLNRDKSALVVFDLETGKEKELLYENQDYDVSDIFYSDEKNALIYASYTGWKSERKFFDSDWEKDFKHLEKEIGDYEIALSSLNDSEDKAIIRTYSDRSLGSYYFFDRTTEEISKICDVSPWIDEDQMAKTTPIEYTSRDGLTINGYLTLPKGRVAKNLPVVINVHGGPWARDHWGFNPEVQFLANRGYAVLQMNFRGSTGYGKEFWQSSFGQWGKAMQDDVTDGVNWLISQGIADKEKVAIYGASYGGYATLAGLAFTPDVYACGIDYVGVSNLFTFMESIPPYWEQYRTMLYEMVGHPVNDSVALVATSPVFHVDKINVPLLVAQGANDPRVKKAESDQIVKALSDRGIDIEYIVKENEGHGFHNIENRYEFYGAMELFLDKHIGKGKDSGPM